MLIHDFGTFKKFYTVAEDTSLDDIFENDSVTWIVKDDYGTSYEVVIAIKDGVLVILKQVNDRGRNFGQRYYFTSIR